MAELNGKWKLIEAAGQPIPGNYEFEFNVKGKALAYKYGNYYLQGYEVDGNTIKFSRATGTLMFFQLEPSEYAVVEAISSSTIWAVLGNTLTLYKKLGTPNAVLEKIET